MKKISIIFLLLLISCSQKEYVDYKCDFNDILIRYYNDGRLDYSDKFNNVNAFQIVNNDKLLSFKIINVNNKLFQFLIDKKENLKSTLYSTVLTMHNYKTFNYLNFKSRVQYLVHVRT